MKLFYLTLFAAFVLSSCVKLQINPGDVVGDSVDAGKELYQTIKRKRNGEEERQYTYFIESATQAQDTQNIVNCLQQIQGIIEASPTTLSKVLSESSEVVMVEDKRKVKCEKVVLVVPD